MFWGKTIAFLYQLYHFVVYELQEPKMQLENGMLIVSIDIDVGNKQIGLLNKGKNDANVNANISEYRVGEIEEQALLLFIDFFDDFEIPATFAVRGQLTEVDTTILKLLAKSKHDVGSHGYYHREFTNLSHKEAENELRMISEGMKKFGVTPKSFVFPSDSVAHLNLLENYGYKCYRGRGGFLNNGMYIEKRGKLYNVHPSFFLGEGARASKTLLLKKIIDISAEKKLPLHLWFHLWDFGETEDSISKTIRNFFWPLFKYAKKKVEKDTLTFETMLSAAKETEKSELLHAQEEAVL